LYLLYLFFSCLLPINLVNKVNYNKALYKWCLLYFKDSINGSARQHSTALQCWMQSNRLQLNASNSEPLWCATARQQHRIPQSLFRIGCDTITASTTVLDLGIFIDAGLKMRSHVERTVCCLLIRGLTSAT